MQPGTFRPPFIFLVIGIKRNMSETHLFYSCLSCYSGPQHDLRGALQYMGRKRKQLWGAADTGTSPASAETCSLKGLLLSRSVWVEYSWVTDSISPPCVPGFLTWVPENCFGTSLPFVSPKAGCGPLPLCIVRCWQALGWMCVEL